MTQKVTNQLQRATIARRKFLIGAAGTAGLVAVGGLNSQARASAMAAATMTTDFGVCIHSNFRTSIYGNDAKVLDAVVRSKARYVRDLLMAGTGFDQDALWGKYIAAGVKGFHGTVGIYGKANDKAANTARMLKSASKLVEVAGFNEPDSGGVSIGTWLAPTVEWQKYLFTTVKKTPALSHIRVGLGSLRGANSNLAVEQAKLMESCAGYFDFANLHIYPGASNTLASIDKHLAYAKGHPVVVSEYGGTTANMSLAQQAKVLSDGLPYLAGKGAKAYVYELMDDADPTGQDMQSNFGVYESSWADKPGVVALRSLA
jgi:Glycosyl hydrolase catalytic core